MRRRRVVRVPASSANLGPGFDTLAAALALHVEVEVAETGRFAVHTELSIDRDRRNLCVRGFELLHPPDVLLRRGRIAHDDLAILLFRGGITIVKRTVAPPTATMVKLCPIPHKLPIASAARIVGCRVTIVLIAIT